MPTFTRTLSDLLNDDFDIGLSNIEYPIFDETYREHLNKKIKQHYWNYEIGAETESMFRFFLNRKMNEIMPLYNQLYLSTRITFDPMKTVDFSDVFNGTITSTSTNTENINETENKNDTATSDATTNAAARTVNSDTPQVLLSPNEDYASSAANTISENTNTQNATSTSGKTDVTDLTGSRDDTVNNDNTRTVQGFQGITGSDMLLKYRATLINIDMDVIKELETCFMLIWDNGDEFTDGVYYGFPYFYYGIL